MTNLRFHRLLVATAVALPFSLSSMPAFAQEFGQAVLDLDGDGRLERREFLEAFGPGQFGRFDLDGDDQLGEEEFGRALFRLWDDDGSGALSIDEWDDGVDRWFGEDPVDLSVSEWDPDGDGSISYAEFEAELGTTELFGNLDLDAVGTLDAAELGGGLFDAGDRDEDGLFDGADEDGFLTNLAELFFTDEDEPFEPDAAEILDAEPDGDARDPLDDGAVETADLEPGGDAIDPVDVEASVDDAPADEPLIERGEAFTALPVPCGAEGCKATAEAFCEALGYEPPIGTLARDDALHVIRCADEI
ncbi:hypothetical protein [Jannaschia formosa]|uniref:hypothetical protein n=1 Tax=Jannaschia formosa TaxID=2259592 RepID=UPI000E1BC494|nr:hypothetical protein [Jannaschia formosa]TFL15919.1 hypothetical protein DR046_22855 [Jannaschia formosa]